MKHVVASLLSNLAVVPESYGHNRTRIAAVAPHHHACGISPQHQAQLLSTPWPVCFDSPALRPVDSSKAKQSES